MKNARMQFLGCLATGLGFASLAFAADGHRGTPASTAHETQGPTAKNMAPAPAGPVMALQSNGKPVRAGEVFTAAAETTTLIDKANHRIELSPHSVVEFGSAGEFKLLRGSAILASAGESHARTNGARLDYAGRVLLSYDHKELSTSAFVLEGEARLVNPFSDEQSLRLDRYRGATMVAGAVMPKLVRQLDLAGVRGWMEGYGWPSAKIGQVTSGLPGSLSAEAAAPPAHVKEVKLEDYFSSIDTADESSQPDYYERKFADPDRVVAEANAKKESSKELRPEEAALIALPSTNIDLGFTADLSVLSSEEQAQQLKAALGAHGSRAPASVGKPKAAKAKAKAATRAPAQVAETGDQEIGAVLSRLRAITPKDPVVSRLPEASGSRGPASVGGAVPDPVYDYSENF